MTSILINGQDKTRQFTKWTITSNSKDGTLTLTGHFRSGKSYTWPLDQCQITPTHRKGACYLRRNDSNTLQAIASAEIVGERFAVVRYADDGPPYVFRLDTITLIDQTPQKQGAVFRYLEHVADERRVRAPDDKEQMVKSLRAQLDQLPSCAGTALHAYLTGKVTAQAAPPAPGLIYPFGVNASQLAAVERALHTQVSVIEGPPGTGKTQTILNIVANILLRNQTVAILSNNNAAVDNVYEKLEKTGLGHLFAQLGNTTNRDRFFTTLPTIPAGLPDAAPSIEELQALFARVQRSLDAQNQLAQLRADINELSIERERLLEWQQLNAVQAISPLDRYNLSPRRTAALMAYLSYLGNRRIGLRDRMELLFRFRLFRMTPLANDEARLSFFHALQLHFYDTLLACKRAELADCQTLLDGNQFTSTLSALTTGSMRHLKQHLHGRIKDEQAFTATDYRTPKHFDAFTKRFPIIGSSTHSIVNSIARGAILDYVIIDEASQQDIMPGILALGCARNMVIVGDRRQLPHIPEPLGLTAPDDAYDCEKHSLLDSCIAVFTDALPCTLLKEHYRCHPRIIQFCNQQFYANALIPMTSDEGEQPLRLLVTAKGNHTRRNENLREIDSTLHLLDQMEETCSLGEDGRGFIAPYKAQIALAQNHLPADIQKKTVHKFQGRECDEIVFSTVLDKKRFNQARLDFVDDPAMINVAVSRAKNRFTLVTGDDVFTRNNRHIAALIRHIEYYAADDQLIRAPVVSAFDLLYREYDQSLEQLNARLRAKDSIYRSEQIVACILRDALALPEFTALTFHMQVPLNQLASMTNRDISRPERTLMQQGASCDFVLYYKVGKRPVGVIEVDGGSHDTPVQVGRDALKDSILAKSHLPLLRLRTVESGIEDRVKRFVGQWAERSEKTA